MEEITPVGFADQYYPGLTPLSIATTSAFYTFGPTHIVSGNLIAAFGRFVNWGQNVTPAMRVLAAWKIALEQFRAGSNDVQGFAAITKYGPQILVDTLLVAQIDLRTVLSGEATTGEQHPVVFVPSIQHMTELSSTLVLPFWMQAITSAMEERHEAITFVVDAEMADHLELALGRPVLARQILENVGGNWWSTFTVSTSAAVAAA